MTSQAAWDAVAEFWPRANTSRFVTVGNIDFHVQISGSGEDVLLLHGAGASAHSFAGLAARLSEQFRVIAPDLPGQGFTTLLPLEAVGLAPFAHYLKELVSKVEATPRWIIGHSAGAALAAEYALATDSPPKGILCINAAFNPFGSIAAPLFSKAAKWFAQSDWLPRVLAAPALRWRATSSMLADTGSALDPLMSQCYDTLLADPDHIAGTLRMMAGWDLPPLLRRLPSLPMPVWLAAAEGDRTIPPERSTSVEGAIPLGHAVRIPALGHLAHEEAPELFDELFRELIAQTTD